MRTAESHSELSHQSPLDRLNEADWVHGRLDVLPDGGVRFRDRTAGCATMFLGAVLLAFAGVNVRDSPSGVAWQIVAAGAVALLLYGAGRGREINATPEGLTFRRLLFGWCYWRRFIPRQRVRLSVQYAGHAPTGDALYKLRYGSKPFQWLPGSSSQRNMRRLKKLLMRGLAGRGDAGSTAA